MFGCRQSFAIDFEAFRWQLKNWFACFSFFPFFFFFFFASMFDRFCCFLVVYIWLWWTGLYCGYFSVVDSFRVGRFVVDTLSMWTEFCCWYVSVVDTVFLLTDIWRFCGVRVLGSRRCILGRNLGAAGHWGCHNSDLYSALEGGQDCQQWVSLFSQPLSLCFVRCHAWSHVCCVRCHACLSRLLWAVSRVIVTSVVNSVTRDSHVCCVRCHAWFSRLLCAVSRVILTYAVCDVTHNSQICCVMSRVTNSY